MHSLVLFLPYLVSCFLQNGLATKVEKSRKQLKERKNRAKKVRGVKKVREWFYLWLCFDALLQEQQLTLIFTNADKGWRRCKEEVGSL
jgi:hypothetical protein